MRTELREAVGEFTKLMIFTLSFMVIGCAIVGEFPNGIALPCLLYGLYVCNQLRTHTVVVLPWFIWIVVFVIGLLVASYIGAVVLPYKLIKSIVKIIIAYRHEKVETQIM